MYKSAFASLGGYSFVVSWETKSNLKLGTVNSVETRSRGGALRLCADLNTKHKATCHMIDCRTGKKIKKLV